MPGTNDWKNKKYRARKAQCSEAAHANARDAQSSTDLDYEIYNEPNGTSLLRCGACAYDV